MLRGAAALAAVLVATPVRAQAAQDAMVSSVLRGSRHAEAMFTSAAEQMTDQDYPFRQSPDVRTFGQLLAHVADTNYLFCATAMGVTVLELDVERTATTKAAIRAALAESFLLCEPARGAMTGPRARALVTFRGKVPPSTDM